ncbi:MAG: hypothetical protein ACRDSN_16340, partial [Pseudonocardiaceae bacterium]
VVLLHVDQLGQCALARAAGDDPRTAFLASWLHSSSAGAYARMDEPRQAVACLSRSRDDWEPPDAFQRADFDWGTADSVWRLGRLDDAEPFAASAARTFSADERRDGVKARLTLATIQVQAGESGGLVLARQVIDEVAGAAVGAHPPAPHPADRSAGGPAGLRRRGPGPQRPPSRRDPDVTGAASLTSDVAGISALATQVGLRIVAVAM